MKDRREEIMKAARPAIPEQFSVSGAETARYCDAHKKELVCGFLGAVKEAVGQARAFQEEKKKGKIKYLLFSHLFSSMFLKDYQIRIELLDEQFYGDMEPAVSYWDAGGIYRLFEEDVERIRQRVEERVNRIREYEADDIRYLYYPWYHQIAKEFIRSMVEAAPEKEALLPEALRGETLKVSFGEYMGEAELLFILEKGAAGQ